MEAGRVPPPPPLAPPPPPPPPPAYAWSGVAPRPHRRRRVLLSALVVIVIGAGTVGGLFGFRLLNGSADSLVSLAPSDSVVYVDAHLDPSAGQKLALNGLLDKFPALSGSSRDDTINRWLDTALKQVGLTHTDVRPWLGNDISVVVPANAFDHSPAAISQVPSVTVLVSSTDDSAAQAAVDKVRQRSSSNTSTATYHGVTVTTAPAGGQPVDFAVAGHALIIGTTAQAVDEVIDTAQGRHAALQSNTVYTRAVEQLPSDRIGVAFVDIGALAQQVAKAAGQGLGQGSAGALQGYSAVALALVAQSNGLSVTGVEDFDASKLDTDQRTALRAAPHVNGSLSFMPRSAYVAGTLTGIKQTIQSLLDSFGSGSGLDVNSILQQLGLTGPGGVIDHLNGDAGIDLTPSLHSDTPGGAIVVGTDSDSVAQSFVTNLMDLVCDCAASDPAQVTQQPYGGTVITSLNSSPGDRSGIDPSWAVFHGWIIAGSSPDQVKAALDADRGGATLATNPDYTAVMSQVGGSNNGGLFVDMQPLLSVIRSALPLGVQVQYDHDVAPNLTPLKAFGMAVHNSSDHVTINAFTLIP